jgi:threonine dehydrogenase-like Zn-dependent dehydrogenase
MANNEIPKTQNAVQLIGPDKLTLNRTKEVTLPGAHQILCRVEAVGLCFSDLKLLKQFSSHVRKGEIVSGIEPEILKTIPSYVPGQNPTVPGHEAVVRVCAVGEGVDSVSIGKRYLVQTDYRWLATASSNASLGYNFEGALQEYVLMDERVITSPQGELLLIDASEELSAASIGLVEPWACVEDAYAVKEGLGLKPKSKMLVVAESKFDPAVLKKFLANKYSKIGGVAWVFAQKPKSETDIPVIRKKNIDDLSDGSFDDILYFGANPETLESLFPKLAAQGVLNIILCGGKLWRNVVTPVGRVHYGGIRIIGTTTSDPADATGRIPHNGEIRKGDKINVIGAGGPMGMMHVIRNICQGVEGVSVYASDVDDNRLETLSRIAAPLARKNGVRYRTFNPKKEDAGEKFDYTAIMAPIPVLVAASVHGAAEKGLINIFAGIPATVAGEIDLDAYIEKRLYFIGTSGSTLDDMKRMLEKAESGRLDTNVSVAAVSGLDGAVEGIRAVENRTIAGKIIVYPACKGLGLTRLEELNEKLPEVGAKLKNGLWTNAAEKALLAMYES